MDIKKFNKSFHYAISGIDYALKNDQNLVIHFIVSFIVIIASILFQVTAFEMGILGISMVMVVIAEMLNTAIEKMVDLITREHRNDAKIAKDVSSGMVLLTVTGAVIIGMLVFLPHVLNIFR